MNGEFLFKKRNVFRIISTILFPSAFFVMVSFTYVFGYENEGNRYGIDTSIPPYTTQNIFTDLSQCTAFAWGRALDRLGVAVEISGTYRHACRWWLDDIVDPILERSSVPRKNSFIVWAESSGECCRGECTGNWGHVAYVEEVTEENGEVYVYINEANVLTNPTGGGYDGFTKKFPINDLNDRGSGIGVLQGYIYLENTYSNYCFWNFDNQGTEDWNARNALNQGLFHPPWAPDKHFWQIGSTPPNSNEKRGIVSPELNLVDTNQFDTIEITFGVNNRLLNNVDVYYKMEGEWISTPESIEWYSGDQQAGHQNTYRVKIGQSGHIEQIRIDFDGGCSETEDCRIYIDEIRFIHTTSPQEAPYVQINHGIQPGYSNLIDINSNNEIHFRITVSNTGDLDALLNVGIDLADGDFEFTSNESGYYFNFSNNSFNQISVTAGGSVNIDYVAKYIGSNTTYGHQVTNTARIMWIDNYYDEDTNTDLGGHGDIDSDAVATVGNQSSSSDIPQNLTISDVLGGFRINWDQVPGDYITYKIYWGNDDSVSEYNYAGILETSTTYYDHIGLEDGSTYYYKVMACNTTDSACSELTEYQNKLYTKQPEDFYIITSTIGGIPSDDGLYTYFRLKAVETSFANLGNETDTPQNGSYHMALFPGTYNFSAAGGLNSNYFGEYTYFNIRERWVATNLYEGFVLEQSVPVSSDQTRNFNFPIYELTGQVTDTNGVPIPGVGLRYDNYQFGYGSTTTSSEAGNVGRYKLYFVPGAYDIEISPPEGTRFAKTTEHVTISGNQTFNIVLESQNLVSGMIGGIPSDDGLYTYFRLKAVETSFANLGNETDTPQNGSYQIALADGTYNFSAAGGLNSNYFGEYTYFNIRERWVATNLYEGFVLEQSVPVSSDQTRNFNFPIYELTGLVTDTNGVPIPGVELRYDNYQFGYGSTTTSSEPGNVGRYKLYFVPGAYNLIVTAPPDQFPPFEIKALHILGDTIRNITLSYDYTVLDEAIEALSPDLNLHLDVFDVIDQGQSSTYDVPVTAPRDQMELIVNWDGSEVHAEVFRPDGSLYGDYQSETPPIIVQIANPDTGTWSVKVTAVQVPYDNYPIAVVAGITPNDPPVADANGPYSGYIAEAISFDGTGSYDPNGDIVLFEWDWDNDGIYDENTTQATASYSWSAPFNGTVGLRVTDNEGAVDYDYATVEILPDPLDVDDDGDGFTENQGDCDDTDGTIYPAAEEIPYDGIDQNCDGADLTDVDQDGYIAVQAGGTDCNDENSDINPGATEVCDDAVDNNCDGQVDEGCATVPGDLDGDGDIDRDDVYVINAHRNQPADVCPECDIDGDGTITVLDARKLMLMCTCPRCICD